MKRLNLVNVIDEDVFRQEVVADFPSSWSAEYECKDGDCVLSFDERFTDAVERRLKMEGVRYTDYIEC